LSDLAALVGSSDLVVSDAHPMTAVAAQITAKAPRGRKPGKLSYRQNFSRKGYPPRYRDLTPGEWSPCPACKVSHGGYCYPWDGATVADWQDVT